MVVVLFVYLIDGLIIEVVVEERGFIYSVVLVHNVVVKALACP